MNGFTKIDRWLKGRGYNSEYICQEKCVDVYRVSNGLYILVNSKGKPWYILSKTDKVQGHALLDFAQGILLDFSQGHFIKRLEQTEYFK